MTPCYITALQCPYIIIYYYYHPIIPSKLYRQKIALNNLKCRPLSGCHQVRSAPHSDATDATGGEVFICPHAERFDAPSVWLTIQDRICRGVGRVEPPPLLISTPPPVPPRLFILFAHSLLEFAFDLHPPLSGRELFHARVNL